MRKLLLSVAVLAMVAGCAPHAPYQEAGLEPPPAPMPSPPPPPPMAMAAPVTVMGMRKSSAPVVQPRIAPSSPTFDEKYAENDVAAIKSVAQEPVSTFSVDVDTGAYANVRRFLKQGQRPPRDAVRTEELLNYFRYDYPLPKDPSQPFSVNVDVSTTPWNPNTRLVRVGLRAYDVARTERPPANLVFLIDVSGSMDEPDKLPLVKTALGMVADRMRPDDRVSVVIYSGQVAVVLEPTSSPDKVRAAIQPLKAAGSTAGGEAMAMAYQQARSAYIEGGINRVIMATDGDFNVGISGTKQIEELVKAQRDSGITLTVLGFGQGNYNEDMMERVADVGNGNYAYIDSAQEARKVLDEELSSTLFTVASDVKIQVEFNPAQVSEYRLIGYENRILAEEDFDNDQVDAGDIGAGHQVTAIYEIVPAGKKGWLPERRYEGNKPAAPETGKGGELMWVKLRYKLPGQAESKLIERPVQASLVGTAKAPSGDMAFAVGVAAYGQILRGDTNMNGFTLSQVRTLVGEPKGFVRNEFVELTDLAESAKPLN